MKKTILIVGMILVGLTSCNKETSCEKMVERYNELSIEETNIVNTYGGFSPEYAEIAAEIDELESTMDNQGCEY